MCLNGHSINASGNFNVIKVNSNITFTLTDCQGNKGKITHSTNRKGIGVYNIGTFNMYGGNISSNVADYGGGVYNYGNFNMHGGCITNNTGTFGGGIHNDYTSGTFNMYYGNISDNIADYGGGVYNYRNFNMYGGSVTGNKARNVGGGVYNITKSGTLSSTVSIYGGNISGNTSYRGAGVYNYSGNIYMSGGNIFGNGYVDTRNGDEEAKGGGIYVTTRTGSLYVSGNVNIFGNVVGGTLNDEGVYTVGKTSNVYLDKGKTLYVDGALSDSSKIGVAIDSYPGTVACVESGKDYKITNADFARFISDNSVYETVLFHGEVWLQKATGMQLTADDFTFSPPSNRTYSGTAKGASFTTKNGISVVTSYVKYYDIEGNELVSAPKNSGTYTVKIDVKPNENYKAAIDLTNEDWKFTIEPKELTVSVSDVTINKGQNIPSLTVNVTGFVNGEKESTLAGFEKPTASVSGSVNTLDTTITSFNVSYTGGNPTKNYTFSKNTTAKITINEVNIEEDDYSTSKDVNVWQKEDIILSPANGYRWISADGVNWEDSLTLSTEGESSQTFYLKKDDGTVTESKTIEYKLDKTAPSDVKIQYNRNGFKSFLNTITFGLFFKENVEVTAQADDASSGIAGYQYYASDSEVQDVSTITGWKDSLTLTPNSKKIVYIKVTDNAGNVTITNNEGVVVYSDSMVSPSARTFDKNVEKQADITVEMTMNDNTLREIKNGDVTLISGTDYTINGNTVTISKDYLENFEKGSTQTLTFVFNPMGVAGDTTSTAALEISIDDSTHYHNAVHHERIEATCTENGSIEYWSCTGCNKLFSNAECTDEITDVVIPAINHKNAVHHERVEATCTENGNNAYWYCPDCSKYFADSEGTINGTIAYNNTESFVINALGHSFKNYVSDGNATYFEDGTETAHCDHHGCTETDTRTAVGSKLVDLDKPTADIKIKGSSIKQIANILTFGLFFKETQTVTVNASDVGSGVAQTAYYLANTEISDFSDVTWTEFSDTFSISPNNRYVIYVKVTDKVGNFSIINSDGVVLDSIAPQISVIDGKTYCGAVEVEVSDDNLDSVTLDGKEVMLADGKFTVYYSDKEQTIVATDKAGNQTAVTIIVNDGHTWDEGEVTTPATAAAEGVKTYTCIHCGETGTESIDKLPPEIVEGQNSRWNKTSGGGLTFRSNAALEDFVSVMVDGITVDANHYDLKEGSTIATLKPEYLATLPAGKHTLSINSTSGTASTEFTIEKEVEPTKPADTNSPSTGDKTNMGLWIALIFVSLCVLTTFGVSKKRRKEM